MAKQKILDEESRRRIEEFEREQKRRRIINYATLVASCIAAIVLVVIFSGNRFAPLLNAMGMESAYDPAGIYADCSKREYRNSPFCQQRDSQSDKQWRGLRHTGGRHIPFSLSNKP